mgnify:CR=1 FL=1
MASDDGTIVERMAAAIVSLYHNVVTPAEAGKAGVDALRCPGAWSSC